MIVIVIVLIPSYLWMAVFTYKSHFNNCLFEAAKYEWRFDAPYVRLVSSTAAVGWPIYWVVRFMMGLFERQDVKHKSTYNEMRRILKEQRGKK